MNVTKPRCNIHIGLSLETFRMPLVVSLVRPPNTFVFFIPLHALAKRGFHHSISHHKVFVYVIPTLPTNLRVHAALPPPINHQRHLQDINTLHYKRFWTCLTRDGVENTFPTAACLWKKRSFLQVVAAWAVSILGFISYDNDQGYGLVFILLDWPTSAALGWLWCCVWNNATCFR